MNIEEKEALDRLLLDISCLDELTPFLNRVNLFDVLKSTKTEIRHSNVLAWLLDANGNHGLGDLFLRRFIEKVLNLNSSQFKSISDWALLSFDTEIVLREWHPVNNKSLDILVLLNGKEKSFLIAIENKIDSKEGKNQTKKYADEIEKSFGAEYEKMYVFLTPNGDSAEDERWGILTYAEIKEILEEALKNENLNKNVRFILSDYLEILGSDIMENYELIEVCTKIYEKHKKALDLIFENKRDDSAIVADRIKSVLANMNEIDYKEEYSSGNTYIRFKVKELDELFPDVENGSNGSDWKNKKTRYFFEIYARNLKFADELPINLAFAPSGATGDTKERLDALKIKSNAKTTKYTAVSNKNLLNDTKALVNEADFDEILKEAILAYTDKAIKDIKAKLKKNA